MFYFKWFDFSSNCYELIRCLFKTPKITIYFNLNYYGKILTTQKR